MPVAYEGIKHTKPSGHTPVGKPHGAAKNLPGASFQHGHGRSLHIQENDSLMDEQVPSSPLFQISNRDLHWQGNTVLRDLNIEIRAGEKVALIGESGAGKSTLLKALYQQGPDDIAFCQQAPALVPGLSLFHNIYMGVLSEHHFFYNALNLFFPRRLAKQKVGKLAHELGLHNHLSAKAETLSGGQQQRAALARTLIQNKDIFLGDEPVSALDEIQGERLIARIVDTHDTVILALHNTQHALKYCQRIIGLKDGVVALDCPVSQLKIDDLHAVYSEQGFRMLRESLNTSDGASAGKKSAKQPDLKICR